MSTSQAPWPAQCISPIREQRKLIGFQTNVSSAIFAGNRFLLTTLPTGFFNYELTRLDPLNNQKLTTFINKWGMPFSPIRTAINSPLELMYPEDSQAIAITNRRNKSNDGGIDLFISLEETQLTIRRLQICVKEVIDYALLKAERFDNSLLIFGSGRRLIEGNLTIDGRNTPDGGFWGGTLTAAICNQILEAVDDPAIWKICAADDCDRIYKRQPNTTKRQPQFHAKEVSDFCSIECSSRMRKQGKSLTTLKANKQEIVHGK
jgi:hypothetical protein